LANVLKSIIAALVESSGNERAAIFVRDFIITQIVDKDLHTFWEPKEPIKLLSDILARDGIQSPEPRLIGCSGKNTILACFRVGLYTPLNKEMIGLGEFLICIKYYQHRFTFRILLFIIRILKNRFW